MISPLRNLVWRQFGATLDMLENAITACPDHVWGDRPDWHEFWYLAYHTLFFVDLYLSDAEEGFRPPEPFGLEELDPAGVLPPRVYAKSELLAYLEFNRQKCRRAMQTLTEERALTPCDGLRPGLTFLELHIYNLRHVQHHTAQLNLILRQRVDAAPKWVSKTKIPLFDD